MYAEKHVGIKETLKTLLIRDGLILGSNLVHC
jgi:hypothetical protein